MVRLASIHHDGTTKLVAQLSNDCCNGGYCDLSSIASNALDFFSKEDNVTKANALIEQVKQTIMFETETGTEKETETGTVKGSVCSTSPHPMYIPLKSSLPSDDEPKSESESCRTSIEILAPIDGSLVGKFLCIGMNYVDHCTEQNVPIPKFPVVFSKFGSCIVGPNVAIAKDETTEKLDYEVELGVVIGNTVPRYTSKEIAKKYIGGFTVVHDVSARDWQLEKNGGQWLLGKSMDGYAPIGPVIVTTDEINVDDAHNLGIRCRINGKVVQNSNTNQMVFGVDDIISFVSQFITLHPGDIIATGTPPGVGCFRDPPRWLRPGDKVECEIDNIGTLTNPIVGPIAKSGPEHAANNFALAQKKPLGVDVTGVLSTKVTSCIVTGGARGLGYGIAAKLGTEGAKTVTIIDLDHASVEKACNALSESVPGCRYFGEVCDIGDYTKVSETWSKIASRNNGKIDILVQAAGIVGATNLKTENVDPDNFDAVFRVNVRGIFNGCKAVLPYMRENNYGRIVNISSIAGKDGNAGMCAYSASKAAVVGLTKTIGKEYAETGDITCNAICPAVVRTKMVEDMPPEQVKYMTDKIPMKRCGTIDEIASTVLFMVSPDASFTTGFCFDATGGRSVY